MSRAEMALGRDYPDPTEVTDLFVVNSKRSDPILSHQYKQTMAKAEIKLAEFANVHEYFTEIDEVKGLISSLPDIYNDQVAYETSYERFTCR